MSRVLILEDENILGKFYKEYLERYHFQTILTNSPLEALKIAEIYPAEYVLLDYGLKNSKLTGLDILPRLRELLPFAKIIMFTSYANQELEHKSLSLGADFFLNKLSYKIQEVISFF